MDSEEVPRSKSGQSRVRRVFKRWPGTGLPYLKSIPPSPPIRMNYSIEGLGLKLNTREDIAPYLLQIEPNITHLEEIHLCGNTIGVGAAQALAEVLNKASAIRVRTF
jgi:hypothetical protein